MGIDILYLYEYKQTPFYNHAKIKEKQLNGFSLVAGDEAEHYYYINCAAQLEVVEQKMRKWLIRSAE